MKQVHLSKYTNVKDEEQFVEKITNNVFQKWNKKLEILARICDYYWYLFKFYPNGRLVLYMADKSSEWEDKNGYGHFEYYSLDDMLIKWLDTLRRDTREDTIRKNKNFEEEIIFIESMYIAYGLKDKLQEKEVKTVFDPIECCIKITCGNICVSGNCLEDAIKAFDESLKQYRQKQDEFLKDEDLTEGIWMYSRYNEIRDRKSRQ